MWGLCNPEVRKLWYERKCREKNTQWKRGTVPQMYLKATRSFLAPPCINHSWNLWELNWEKFFWDRELCQESHSWVPEHLKKQQNGGFKNKTCSQYRWDSFGRKVEDIVCGGGVGSSLEQAGWPSRGLAHQALVGKNRETQLKENNQVSVSVMQDRYSASSWGRKAVGTKEGWRIGSALVASHPDLK